jgi:type IV secretory pathway VirB4 component
MNLRRFIPGLRRSGLKLPYADTALNQQRMRVEREMQWHYPNAPDMITLKCGAWMRAWSVLPYNREGEPDSYAMADLAAMNNAIRRLGYDWCLYTIEQRRKATDYPDSEFPCASALQVDNERRRYFTGGNVYGNACSVVLIHRPPGDTVNRIRELWVRDEQHMLGSLYEQEIDKFRQKTDEIAGMMSFMPQVKLLQGDDLTTYLHSFVSTRTHPVRMKPHFGDLPGQLCDMPFYGGENPALGTEIIDPETGEVVYSDKHWLRTISLRDFPSSTDPLVFKRISDLEIEFDRVNRWFSLDYARASGTLKAFWRGWYNQKDSLYKQAFQVAFKKELPNTNRTALTRVKQIEAAEDEIGAGLVSMGYCSSTFTVRHQDFKTCVEQAQHIMNEINSKGYTAEINADNQTEAALGAIPGNVMHDCERPLLDSADMTAMLPLSQIYQGPTEIDGHNQLKGPPRIWCRSRGTNRRRLTLFDGDVGDIAIVGSKGGGKTFAMNLLAHQWLRYPGAVHIRFDRKRGGRIAAMCAGGLIVDPALDGQGVQPLRHCDEPEHRARLHGWICAAVDSGYDGRAEIGPKRHDAISEGLDVVAGLEDPNDRTILAFMTYCPSTYVKQGVMWLTKQGEDGRLFDCVVDRDFRDEFWINFELDSLMENKRARDLMVMHLLLECERIFDGRPVEVAFDEVWQFESVALMGMLEEWIKRLRSFNVHVVLATPSITDLTAEKTAVVRQSTAVQFYSVNKSAGDDDLRALYKQQGLTDQQVDLLASGQQKQHYLMRSHEGVELLDFAVPHNSVQALLCSTEETLVRKATALWKTIADKELFYPAFLRANGFAGAADEAENLLRARDDLIQSHELEMMNVAQAAE